MNDDVDALHALSVGKGDGAVESASAGEGVGFAGRGGGSEVGDGVEEAEAGDVVVAEGEGVGHALVGVGAADDVDGVHDGPVQGLLVGGARVSGEDVVVGLGPAEAEDTAEGSHELVLELKLLFGRGAGTAAVEDEDGVLDVAPVVKRSTDSVTAFWRQLEGLLAPEPRSRSVMEPSESSRTAICLLR